jgi:predicted GTPase
MNAGRLRHGADRYREALSQLRNGVRDWGHSPSCRSPQREPVDVSIVVVGQVKSGKSSLINALLGERRARTNELPVTQTVKPYRLQLPDSPDRLTLWDTIGYCHDELPEHNMDKTLAAFEEADLVLLVMDATSSARRPDIEMLRAMRKWFEARRRLKPPPVLGVLTHIDGLPPVREWDPPYDWEHPSSLKEQNIQRMIEFNRQQFGELLASAIPLCTDVDRDRVYGLDSWLLPAIVALLDESRACAVIRSLHNEVDRAALWKVLQQLHNVGQQLLKSWGRDAV